VVPEDGGNMLLRRVSIQKLQILYFSGKEIPTYQATRVKTMEFTNWNSSTGCISRRWYPLPRLSTVFLILVRQYSRPHGWRL